MPHAIELALEILAGYFVFSCACGAAWISLVRWYQRRVAAGRPVLRPGFRPFALSVDFITIGSVRVIPALTFPLSSRTSQPELAMK